MEEHIVSFEMGHDCIRFECIHGSESCKPGGGGSHGVHGLSIRFVSKGEAGAVQFLLYTGWLPRFVIPDEIGYRFVDNWGTEFGVLPADLGYQAKEPQYEEQEPMSKSCEYCDGEPCYYDGSGLGAADAMYALVNGGGDALWKFLDAYYDARFNGGDCPEPEEYKMSLRKNP